MRTAYWTTFPTPLGIGYVASSDVGVCYLAIPQMTSTTFFAWLDRHFDAVVEDGARHTEVLAQLAAYWEGTRKVFDVPLDLIGTDFQRTVWQALYRIPCGMSISYRQLAEQVGQPKGFQAVGAANGQNPIALIVPCHRVIGAKGNLTGYAGGLETKRYLLQHEGALLF